MTTPAEPMSASNVDLLLHLVRLETKLDMLTQQMSPKVEDHETRLRGLEKNRWPIPSISAAAAILAAASTYWPKH